MLRGPAAPDPMTIDIEVEDPAWADALPDASALARQAALAALPAVPTDDIAILLTDDPAVQDLNARFRGKDAPTNVLSLSLIHISEPTRPY